MTAYDIIWQAVKDKVLCAREDYEAALSAWDVIPVVRGGETVGAVVMKGGEIHCAVQPEYRGRWLTKGMRWMVEQSHKCSTDKGNTVARRFIERLGFRLEYEDDLDAHYAR